MRKKKQKKIIDFFYKIAFIGGKDTKVPYEWKPGEKERYIKVCESVPHWCGIPLDVNWASTTNSYQQALKQLL